MNNNKRIRENDEYIDTNNKISKTDIIAPFDYNKVWNIYSKTNKYPHEITENHMTEHFPNSAVYFKHNDMNDTNTAVFGMVRLSCSYRTKNKGGPYNVVWRSSSDQITSKEHVMKNDGDGYFGINVHNCTYATIFYNGECIELVRNQNNWFIDNCFILPHEICSYDKPIIKTGDKHKMIVHTDGTHMTYNIIVMDSLPRRQIARICYPE
jgi:hypothetical protein